MTNSPLVIAHRGACLSEPENTLAAFRVARELGAAGVELDVHLSADNEMVVHHDADADGVGLLVDANFADIRKARPDIPTLAEVFDVLGKLIVNVELKCCSWDADPDTDHVLASQVVELVRSIGAVDRVVVSSFELAHIDASRAAGPEIATGFLVHGFDPTSAVQICVDRGHLWLHPDWGNLAANLGSVVTAAKAAGVKLNPWTIDDPAVMRQFASAGVDAVITNDPTLALATFAA